MLVSRFVQLGYGRTEYFTWEDTVTDPSRIALSFYSGLFSYTGWNYLNFIIEEMKVREKKEFSHKTPSQNPVRDLPRAIAISCVIVLLIYVLTIVSFHTTLSTAEVTFLSFSVRRKTFNLETVQQKLLLMLSHQTG